MSSTTWHPLAHEAGVAAVDVLLGWLVRDDDDSLPRSLGEWLRAYQRVTHYFRALDVWSPPPHLLAWAVLERAVHRTAGDHGVAPIRLAMDELQVMLREQGEAARAVPDPSVRSGRWRIGSWPAGDGERMSVRHDAGSAPLVVPWTGRLTPVPTMVPAPMVPQPLEGSAFTRALTELTNRIRHFGLGSRWRRGHA
jgi:hypothetical protein